MNMFQVAVYSAILGFCVGVFYGTWKAEYAYITREASISFWIKTKNFAHVVIVTTGGKITHLFANGKDTKVKFKNKPLTKKEILKITKRKRK